MNDTSSSTDIIKVKQGKVLFLKGETSRFLYIIKIGEIKLFEEVKGALVPVAILEPRDFIEDDTLFTDNVTNHIAIATKDTELVKVKKSELKEVFNDCPEWMINIMGALTDRLNNSLEMLKEHNIEPAESSKLHTSKQLMVKYLASIEGILRC